MDTIVIFVVRTNVGRSFHPGLVSALYAAGELRKAVPWRDVDIYEVELNKEFFLDLVLPLLSKSEFGDFKYSSFSEKKVKKEQLSGFVL